MSVMPPLNGLRAFEAAARLGSITEAARTLFVTPSAVSHQVKRLEEQLGIKLLERVSNRIQLTQDGETYYREISAVFAGLESATTRLLKKHDHSVITVSMMPVFSIKWLVPRLYNFHQKHPEVEVRVSTSYNLIDLRHSDMDMAIRWGAGKWPGLNIEKMMRDTAQPVCSPRLLSGRHKPRCPTELLGQTLIEMGEDRNDWEVWADLYGLTRPAASKSLRFDDPLGAIQAAINGLGVALAPKTLVDEDVAAGHLVAPLNQPVLLNDAYYLVYTDKMKRNPAAVHFRDWLIATAAEYSKGQPKTKLAVTISA